MIRIAGIATSTRPNTCHKLLVLLSLVVAGCKKADWNAIEQTQLRLIAVAAESFHPSHKRYPNDLAELANFIPYVSSVTVDVWGNPVRYSVSEGAFVVRSAGPDRKFGTVDDVVIRKDDLNLADGKGGSE